MRYTSAVLLFVVVGCGGGTSPPSSDKAVRVYFDTMASQWNEGAADVLKVEAHPCDFGALGEGEACRVVVQFRGKPAPAEAIEEQPDIPLPPKGEFFDREAQRAAFAKLKGMLAEQRAEVKGRPTVWLLAVVGGRVVGLSPNTGGDDWKDNLAAVVWIPQ